MNAILFPFCKKKFPEIYQRWSTSQPQFKKEHLILRAINWPEDKNKEYGINKFSLYHVPVSHSEQCKKAYKGCMNNIFI